VAPYRVDSDTPSVLSALNISILGIDGRRILGAATFLVFFGRLAAGSGLAAASWLSDELLPLPVNGMSSMPADPARTALSTGGTAIFLLLRDPAGCSSIEKADSDDRVRESAVPGWGLSSSAAAVLVENTPKILLRDW